MNWKRAKRAEIHEDDSYMEKSLSKKTEKFPIKINLT